MGGIQETSRGLAVKESFHIQFGIFVLKESVSLQSHPLCVLLCMDV